MSKTNVLSDPGSKSRLIRHIIFWSAFYILDVSRYVFIKKHDPIQFALVFNLSALVVQMGFSYFLCYFVLPQFFRAKTIILAIVYLIIGTYVFAVLNRIIIVHVAEEIMLPKPFAQESIHEIVTDISFLLKRYIPSNIWVALIFISVKYLFNYEQLKRKDLNLEKEKSKAELTALKAQLNPHFLFNTLNNIYALSLENSNKTPESISKLSDMLDHVLYRSDGNLVSLKGEIQLIKNFIELEQLRYDERLKVSFKEDIMNEMELPPLILLSLVENAFKHGAAEDSGSPNIDILVNCKNGAFEFIISNSVVEKGGEVSKESIGLTNIRRQLNLIYGNKHEFVISSTASQFKVVMKIHE